MSRAILDPIIIDGVVENKSLGLIERDEIPADMHVSAVQSLVGDTSGCWRNCQKYKELYDNNYACCNNNIL